MCKALPDDNNPDPYQEQICFQQPISQSNDTPPKSCELSLELKKKSKKPQ